MQPRLERALSFTGSDLAAPADNGAKTMVGTRTVRSEDRVGGAVVAAEFDVTISLRRRRIILPLRVFGKLSVKRICSGLAKLPISCPTHLRSSSASFVWL